MRKALAFITTVLLFAAVSPLDIVGQAEQAAAAQSREAADTTAHAHAHDFDMQHIELNIRPDFARRSAVVVETLTFIPTARSFSELRLDSDGPVIESVRSGGGELQFRQEQKQVAIAVPSAAAQQPISVEVRYHVKPRGGLVFYPGDVRHPDQADTLWTSGEPNSAHLWLPIYDHPDDKLTADFTITAPAPLWVIANGELTTTRKQPDGWTEFHWHQSEPISSYLLTFYIGKWTRVPAHAGKVPLEYDIAPDENAAIGEARFGRTPDMVAYFTSLLNVPYPWAKYNEVNNPGFFSGLENASATEFPGDYPENADVPDLMAERLENDTVSSHELAHQWFGDMVTCRDWSHLWLNEGFANFMENVYAEHEAGRDRALWDFERSASEYFEYENEVSHPVVSTEYQSPWDMFDPTTYNKGAWSLHMLRVELGEKIFWQAVHSYLTTYRFGNADTGDFEKIVEQSSGRDLRGFFQQWLYRSGHPSFAASWHWDEVQKAAVLHLTQQPPADSGTAVPYTGRMKIAEWVNATKPAITTVDINQADQTFTMSARSRPIAVQLDPDHEWLKQVKWQGKSLSEWQFEAQHSPWSVDRANALEQLDVSAATLGRDKVIASLAQAAQRDASVPVVSAALQHLAGLDQPRAVQIALNNLRSQDPERRALACEVLAGAPASPLLVNALQPVFRSDPIAHVRASALRALLKQDSAHAAGYVESALKMKSYEWQVERVALQAMGSRGAGYVPVLQQWATPMTPIEPRATAIRALSTTGDHSAKTLEVLRAGLDSSNIRVQASAAMALAHIGDRQSLPAIERLRDSQWIGFFAGPFAAAAEQLRQQHPKAGD